MGRNVRIVYGLSFVLFVFLSQAKWTDVFANDQIPPEWGYRDMNPPQDRVESARMADGLVEDGVPVYIHSRSRFYGWDAAIPRYRVGHEDDSAPCYDYAPHGMWDEHQGKYVIHAGGRYFDRVLEGGDTWHNGDHAFPYEAPPVGLDAEPWEFRGRLTFEPCGVPRYDNQAPNYPSYLWGRNKDPDLHLQDRIENWWIDNQLEPVGIRLFDKYLLITQVGIQAERVMDYWLPDHPLSEWKADRLRLHTSTLDDPYRFEPHVIPFDGLDPIYEYDREDLGRGLVVNITNPHEIKFSWEKAIVEPQDPDGKIFWLYTGVFERNTWRGYWRIRSDDPTTFDWNERERAGGFMSSSQIGYVRLDDGSTLYVAFRSSTVNNPTDPDWEDVGWLTPVFSRDGLNFGASDSVSVNVGDEVALDGRAVLAGPAQGEGNPDHRRVKFPGFTTIDGWGEFESLGNNWFRTYYLTTAHVGGGIDVFRETIGLGEWVFQITDVRAEDRSNTTTDRNDSGVHDLLDRDSDGDGLHNDIERMLGRNPYVPESRIYVFRNRMYETSDIDTDPSKSTLTTTTGGQLLPEQQFELIQSDPGYVLIRSVNCQRYLSWEDSSGVRLEVRHQGNSRQWRFMPAGGGYFTLENRTGDNNYISIDSGDEGAPVLMSSSDEGHNTQWQLVEGPHTLVYRAGTGGGLSGETEQFIADGESGSAVEAVVEDAGAEFAGWSDGNPDQIRIDTNVRGDLDVTALFRSTGGADLDWYAERGIAPNNGEDWTDVDARPVAGKGTTLRHENIADTDPDDPSDTFRILDISSGPPFVITFRPASTERVYTLKTTDDLVDGPWIKVPGAGPRPGGGEATDTLTDDNESTKGPFYRVEVELP